MRAESGLCLFDTGEASYAFDGCDRSGGQGREAKEDQDQLPADRADVGVVFVEFGSFAQRRRSALREVRR